MKLTGGSEDYVPLEMSEDGDFPSRHSSHHQYKQQGGAWSKARVVATYLVAIIVALGIGKELGRRESSSKIKNAISSNNQWQASLPNKP